MQQQKSPIGKLIAFILVLGLAAGVYRWWETQHSPGTPGASATVPGFGGLLGGGGVGEIEFLTTATKSGWVTTEADKFNSANNGKYKVTVKLIESRDAMNAILYGKDKPTIWSPSSPIWINRLITVWGDKHNGQHIAATDDQSDYQVYFKSPIVFITTQPKAAFLKPILTSPNCWDNVRELSLGHKKVPWGTFKFSHADPLNANSGMLTMSLILTEYAKKTNQFGDLATVAGSSDFASYLVQLDKAFVNDASVKGSGSLEKAFSDNPSSRDFITAYESAALEAVKNNSGLAVIYPNPTAVADQSAAILSAPWVTPEKKEGAQAFLKFLGTAESLQDAAKYHFRPASSGTNSSVLTDLSNQASHGFQQSYAAIELPPYNALNEAANVWRTRVASR